MDNNKKRESKDQTEDEKLPRTKRPIGIKSEQANGNEKNPEKIYEIPSPKPSRKTKHSNTYSLILKKVKTTTFILIRSATIISGMYVLIHLHVP